MLRDGKKKSACCLDLVSEGTWGSETFQFQRISGKLSLVDCTSILPIPRPSFGGQAFFQNTFWCADLAPNRCSADKIATPLFGSRRSLFR